MHRISKYQSILLLAMLAACTPEERIYGTDGGGNGGSGAGGMGGQGGTGGGGGLTVAAACDSYATNVCQRFQDCSPATVKVNFGDFETCRTRYQLFCAGILGTEGTGWTPSQMKACGEGYTSLDCNLYIAQPFRSFDALTPTACVPPAGSLADGAGCLDHGQCKTGHCHRTGFSICGNCGVPGIEGETCGTNLDCKGGMICQKGTCRQAGEPGGMCVDGQIPCNMPWSCVNGTCAKPARLMDACGAVDQPPCNFLQGLYCDSNTSTCMDAVLKQPGEACTVPNTLVFCQGAGVCGNASGTCIAPSPEGGPCDPVNGPGCMAPAFCLSGKCTIANSTFCP
jgi:hypothetical protein